MKSLHIREGDTFDWEIVITDDQGQVGDPIGLNDTQLLSLGFALNKYTQTAWQRLNKQSKPPSKFP